MVEPEIAFLFIVGWAITVACFILVYWGLFRFEKQSMEYYKNSLSYLHSIDSKLPSAIHPAVQAISDASRLIVATSKAIKELQRELGA
jgi:hypothetical protein